MADVLDGAVVVELLEHGEEGVPREGSPLRWRLPRRQNVDAAATTIAAAAAAATAAITADVAVSTADVAVSTAMSTGGRQEQLECRLERAGARVAGDARGVLGRVGVGLDDDSEDEV